MIDTHCHLTFRDFAGRTDEVLDHARSLGVLGAITISTTTMDCLDALAIAEAHEHVWCSAGIHPLHAHEGPHLWANLRLAAEHEKCVAWGELGLDNHYDDPPADIQRSVLADQLARIESWSDDGLDMPVIIHCRKAFDDLIPILAASRLDPARFVFHCFTGSVAEAKMVLDFGAMISFTGVVTYRNAKEVAQAAAMVPLDRIMCETDAPFLTPEPHRGKRPCMPGWSRHTAEHIANLRGLSFAEFERAIDDNTERFFGIQVPRAGRLSEPTSGGAGA